MRHLGIRTTLQRAWRWGIAVLASYFKTLSTFIKVTSITSMAYGPRRLFVRFYNQRKAAGQPIYIENIPGTKKLSEEEKQENFTATVPAAPSPYTHPFKWRGMRQGSYPVAEYTLQYQTPPLSGKILAGVGESQKRRVAKFFHTDYSKIYGGLNQAFHLVTSKESIFAVQKVMWDNRKAKGPVAIRQQAIDDPAALSQKLKDIAAEHGAVVTGCTAVMEEAVFEGVESYLPHAFVVAMPMERSSMLTIPSVESAVSIIDGYRDVGQVTIAVARYIRSLGWQAEANTNLGNAPQEVLHIPLAIAAGLGQMGRHTSLITKEYGANVRLAVVLTDIPMAFDSPVDIGVEDVCANCRICAENCPPQAIYEEKVLVRGERKWHLDFDRCTPYFVENGSCGVCITVCPWSESDKGMALSLLQQHRKRVLKSYPALLPPSERLVTLDEQPATLTSQQEQGTVEAIWQKVVIKRRTTYPGRIVELVLANATSSTPLPDWAPGAHIEIELPSGKVRAYSLSNATAEHGNYRIAVKIEAEGTGGSLEIETLQEQQHINIKRPGNNFILGESYDYYYLVAGGIGVTPLVTMAHRLNALGKKFEVHYTDRKMMEAIYAHELDALEHGTLVMHNKRGWVESVYAKCPPNAAVYVCGPLSLMDDIQHHALLAGLPQEAIYREDFGSEHPDKPFHLVLASSGQKVLVEPGQTITRALQARGVYTPVSCGYGICGVCAANVLDGEPDARDHIFTEEEKKTKIAMCCSRSLTDELVIDL